MSVQATGQAVTAFPLSWPATWPRTPARRQATFGRSGTWTVARARDTLLLELERLGATRVIISSNVELRLDGLISGRQRMIHGPGVAVYFQLKGRQLVLACDRWDRVEHNLRALALHVDAIRGTDRWGVGTVSQAFMGYAALPETAGASTGGAWWHVLGVEAEASLEEIEAAFRRLTLERHPDRGGSTAAMAALNEARAAARRARGPA